MFFLDWVKQPRKTTAGDSKGITCFLAAQLNAQLSPRLGCLNCSESFVQKETDLVTPNDPIPRQRGDWLSTVAPPSVEKTPLISTAFGSGLYFWGFPVPWQTWETLWSIQCWTLQDLKHDFDRVRLGWEFVRAGGWEGSVHPENKTMPKNQEEK